MTYKANKTGILKLPKKVLKSCQNHTDKIYQELAKLQNTKIKFMSYAQPAISKKYILVAINDPCEMTIFKSWIKDIENINTNQYQVYEFTYNGFSGNCNEDVIMSYTAELLSWTTDPGIAKFKCSDGKERLIPTFAIKDFDSLELPEQEITGILFGQPSNS